MLGTWSEQPEEVVEAIRLLLILLRGSAVQLDLQMQDFRGDAVIHLYVFQFTFVQELVVHSTLEKAHADWVSTS